MSVMLFDLANDQPGHVAGAQGELESRLGPVLGEGAGPRARVRGWQEGLWTQVGCSYHLFCKFVLTKYFIFYTHCSGQYLGSFPPCWSTCSRTHHVARWLELLIVLQDHLQNLHNCFCQITFISKSFANFLLTFHDGRWRQSCSRTHRQRSSPISSTCSTQVGNFNFDSIL